MNTLMGFIILSSSRKRRGRFRGAVLVYKVRTKLLGVYLSAEFMSKYMCVCIYSR